MRIFVASGTGYGPTELAAFDAAGLAAGVADRNLIYLSSMIPAGADVVEVDGPAKAPGAWGDRLYTVMAQQRASRRGTEVWAGVGWITLDTGNGMFVEHEGDSQAAVEQDIRKTLMALMRNRGLEPDEDLIRMKVAGATCEDQPVCALVVAVYQSHSW